MTNYIWPEITKDTPIEEVKRIHQQIWDYVAEYGRKPDDVYFKYMFGCAPCHYAYRNNCINEPTILIDRFKRPYNSHPFCRICPIKWPNNQACTFPNSLFTKWDYEQDPPQKAKLAKEIRNLPWKFEEGEDET